MTQEHDNLILFDGVCNLCTKSVQFIIRHDRREKFTFLSMQSDLGRKIYHAAGLRPEESQTFVLVTKQRTLIRSEAVIEIATSFGGFWRIFAFFKILPPGLRDGLYSFVARRRYKWFGRRDSCMVPSEEVRKRFLT
jgi:predicted DCC family thiol-disulfide oxidoreductase YuxK